ncbi:septal ring lytic transglycosylase RlpA family protein [Salinicola halimionae]|uniref:septal ring lytic transglycosylase RlpA family protein n=1 Tax=Salinicola halimionae TaxID=1949081 RepID=UPI000DA11090|nr:septal ring lytic transglycosylase RlpA family protein [Salinicola halimionae]
MTSAFTDDTPLWPRRRVFQRRRPPKCLLAVAIASILLAGCASTHHPQGWESTSSPRPVATAAKPGAKPGKKDPGRKEPGAKGRASGPTSDQEAGASARAQADAPKGKKRLGEATYYASYFEGRLTASGEPYDSRAMTAAHKTLPFGTKVQVTALDSGETAVVRINDRGPFVEGRIIDLSRKAAEQLGMVHDGAAAVQLQVLGQ